MGRCRFEVGQLIRSYGGEFFARHKAVPQVHKTFAALAACRTRQLGGHAEICPDCGDVHVSYNSCRDRHCPKCQNKEREQWVEMRREEILPGVKYFHVVFTVPDILHPLAMGRMALFYSCMFKAAWAALKKFFDAEGLQGGMTSVLHTWGSNLHYHPHIHCIVPGGGLGKDGKWHNLESSSRSDFLFPVRALGKIFRAKMMAALTKAFANTGRVIPPDIRKRCFEKGWVVYSRPPAKGVGQVLDYIGRYAYRVAISNSRIKDVSDDGKVTYDYKDYRAGGIHRTMSMDAVDFLHLFSLHVLPPGFVRIRHYGMMSPSNREKVRQAQFQLGGTPVPKQRNKKNYLLICRQKGWQIGMCGKCGAKMQPLSILKPSRSPPKVATGSAMIAATL